jgi:serine/threonine protein kinase
MVTTRIDLAKITKNTSELLNELIIQHADKNEKIFCKEKTYEIWHVNPATLQSEKQQITLSHDIIERPRNKNKNEKRYEIINHNKLIGEGGFSKVYDILATLAIEDSVLRVKTGKKRVVKIQTCNSKELSEIQNEVNITQKAGSIHIKQPTVVNTDDDEYQCYMVMQKLNGTDLYAIITQLYKHAINLTTHQRLTIAINALDQLKILHDKGIVHRDIKPDNIMLDLNTDETVIFDFGLSKTTDVDDKEVLIGTPGYIPPEVFDGKGTTVKSDIYSIAIIIGMLFYADEPQQTKNKCLPYYFKNIFNDPALELNDFEKEELLMTLMQMRIKELHFRLTATEALNEIRNIREIYYLMVCLLITYRNVKRELKRQNDFNHASSNTQWRHDYLCLLWRMRCNSGVFDSCSFSLLAKKVD